MMNKSKNILFFLAISLIFIGCAKDPEIEFKKPKMQVSKPLPVIQRNKGSLYSVKGPSLFADKKDLQIGDLVQVRISESLYSKTNNTREVGATRKNGMGAGVFVPGNSGTVSKIADKLNPLTNIGFEASTQTQNDGEVKTKLDEKFSTSVSAIIEDTYQNGNYYIKGSKEMLIDGQKQSLTLTGVIRPYDITSDNSISSSQVANLQILYIKEGEEQDVMKVPWGIRILQTFWPF